jgi:hypothetical protein
VSCSTSRSGLGKSAEIELVADPERLGRLDLVVLT